MVRGQKILVFSGPGTENIGFCSPGTGHICFWWSGDRKYWFLVVRGQKILGFSGPGTENIDFWCSRDKNIDFLVLRGRFWVGGADGRVGDARNPGPPKALKSKKITKTLKLKLLVNSRKHD